MASIELKYEQARTTLLQAQTEAEQKLKEEQEEYKKRAEELQDAFVKEVGTEVAEVATTTAIAAAGTATEKATKDEVKARLTAANEKLEVSEQLTEKQTDGVSELFAGLLEELQASIEQSITTKMKAAMTPGKQIKEEVPIEDLTGDQDAEGGGGFMVKGGKGKQTSATKPKEGGAGRGRAEVSPDSIIEERGQASKRPGDDLDDSERKAREEKPTVGKGSQGSQK